MQRSKDALLTEENKVESARLKALYSTTPHGYTQSAFGEAFGIGNQGSVWQCLNAKGMPISLKAAQGFARGLNCQIADFSPRLATLAESIAASVSNEVEDSAAQALAKPLQDNLLIPQYPDGGAMGHGVVLEEKQPGVIRSWSVSRQWVQLNVPFYTSAKNLCIVTGFGPSMKPLYNPGDPLLLDRGIKHVDQEGVFFFRLGELGYIKQLQRIPTEDGLVLRAKSLNPSYEAFDITKKMLGDFECFGKILTVWKSEQV